MMPKITITCVSMLPHCHILLFSNVTPPSEVNRLAHSANAQGYSSFQAIHRSISCFEKFFINMPFLIK